MSHVVVYADVFWKMQGKPDKFVLEPLNLADDCVRCCYGRKGAIFKNWPDTLFIDV